ncbi:immunoglobulin A1 protease autotransporter isoform X4 [Oreochromis niloticus]|uniref:immunoglobulin A1 protease autotransporter isoform X4 n=1 Tax=Oreochromis niloticus TaxID=8128 RepID=UPI0009054091|nr:immunoglobulin A1 protease autotransporter isoform X4 [Oreochromis niloticus]
MPWFKRMLRSLGLGILLLSVGLVLSDTFKKVGDKVVLSPGSVSDRITSITWKHGPDIAVEWYGGEIVAYRDFRGRCEVSTSTGALTISNLTVKDSGIYTAEINNRVMSPTKITVISAVPKPTVSKSCNPEMTICTLTCEASITDDTKPVTYSWVIGDSQTPQPSSSQLRIAKNDTGSVEKSISCQLENPVSSERSDNIIISFASGDPLHWIIPVVVAVIAAALLGAGIGFFLWKKNKKGHLEIAPQNVANTSEETVPLVDIKPNGAVVPAPEIHNENELESADDENEGEKFTTISEVKVESGKDQKPAASTDSSSKPETSKTTSEVKNEPSQDQTPAASTDSSSKPDMPALDSKSNETSDSEAKPETETSKTTSEVKNEPSQDQTPAASTDSSSKPETSKTTSEVKDEPSQDQTPTASTDSSSKPDMPALDSQSNETSDSEAKPETDNLQEPQQGPERTT